MKKLWQIILSIGSVLALIAGMLAVIFQADTKRKQLEIREKAKVKKEQLAKDAALEKLRLSQRTDEEVIAEYYEAHPKVDPDVNKQKHIDKALKQAEKYKKVTP